MSFKRVFINHTRTYIIIYIVMHDIYLHVIMLLSRKHLRKSETRRRQSTTKIYFKTSKCFIVHRIEFRDMSKQNASVFMTFNLFVKIKERLE